MPIESVELSPDTWLFRLRGDVDYYTAQSLLFGVENQIDDTHLNHIVDLTEVTHVDTSGLGLFVTLREACRQRGGAFVLIVLDPRIDAVLEKTNLRRILPVARTLDEAVAKVSMQRA